MRPLCLASLFLAAGTVHAYIDTLVCPLDQFNSTFQVIAEGTIEKADAEKKVCIIRLGRALKGKPGITHIRVNVGAGHDWHPQAAMPHLVPGAPVLVWYYWGDGPKAAIYVNRFFLEAYRNQDGAPADPQRVWWHFTAVATLYNRTFNGTVEELTKLLPPMLEGKVKGPAPDPKLPAITRESLAALPSWEQRVDPRAFPLPFRPRRSAAVDAPREPDKAVRAVPGVAFQVHEGSWQSLPALETLKPARTGTAEGLSLPVRDGYAIRFSGYLEIPRDGVYTFILVSNDGSRLRIGDVEVVDNDHFKSAIERSGEISLRAGKHAFRLDYFQHSGFQVLEASWTGPGIPRQPIPASAYFREAAR